MKKLIVASLLLFASQGIFAQYDWSKLSEEYLEMYNIAERVAEQTEKISVDEETGVTFQGGKTSIAFERKLDLRSTKEHYKYTLVKSGGVRIPLDKINTEKVLKRFKSAIDKVNDDLKVNRGAQVDDILSNLFSN